MVLKKVTGFVKFFDNSDQVGMLKIDMNSSSIPVDHGHSLWTTSIRKKDGKWIHKKSNTAIPLDLDRGEVITFDISVGHNWAQAINIEIAPRDVKDKFWSDKLGSAMASDNFEAFEYYFLHAMAKGAQRNVN